MSNEAAEVVYLDDHHPMAKFRPGFGVSHPDQNNAPHLCPDCVMEQLDEIVEASQEANIRDLAASLASRIWMATTWVAEEQAKGRDL